MTKDGSALITDTELRQIVELAETLDKSNLDSLQLDVGRFKLTLGKSAAAPHASAPAQPNVTSTRQSSPPDPISTDQVSTPRKTIPGKGAASAPPAGTIDICAPIMGLFYAKPDPAASPFVTIGTEVQKGATVGLIEVMKIFNAVPAPTKGVIKEICVADAETVEIGQTLFRIRPAT